MSEPESLPRHIAVIMDGNNRWARKRGLPGAAGHKAGVDSVKVLIEACAKRAVEVLSLYAFSSENWQRPPTEVKALMDLFLTVLQKKEVQKLHKNNIRIRFIGRRDRFSSKLVDSMSYTEGLTQNNTGMTVVIAADYGGQWDICEVARCLANKVAVGEIQSKDISPQLFQSHLALGDLPMPDLCIRTSGESRISNFLLWQMAYTELYFTDDYWPDFNEESLQHALSSYASRQRRYGLSGEQTNPSEDNTALNKDKIALNNNKKTAMSISGKGLDKRKQARDKQPAGYQYRKNQAEANQSA